MEIVSPLGDFRRPTDGAISIAQLPANYYPRVLSNAVGEVSVRTSHGR